MLILTRGIGQSIFIDGDEIKLHVLGVIGDKVKIGIDAPADVSVHREEVFHRIARENKNG